MSNRTLAKVCQVTMVLLLAACGSTVANASPQEAKTKTAAKTMTVTGCLQKGDEADEYSISDSGKTYGLRSTNVDLSKHLGHKVTVSGAFRPEAAEAGEENESKEQKAGGKEAGDIQVTTLKMLSPTCQ